jgi:glycosyltransferase involved in cell wall biosynthesis
MFFQQFYDSATTGTLIIAGVLLLATIIQLAIMLRNYLAVIYYRDPGFKRKKIGISVIICARNEEKNLARNLPRFLEQDYPDFEVVVVNDCSSDGTEELLMRMKEKYPNLRYTTIQEDKKFTHGKKLAVTIGIKAARHEHMLFSDADCYPHTNRWISKMSRNFSENTEIVLGVGKYERKPGLLNLLVRYETFTTAVQYLSAAMRKKAYMGVGRNLAYKKTLFFSKKGFASHLKVLSGDDDLFVNEASSPSNTRIELSEESITCSEPPVGFREWFRQKKRHLLASKYYRSASKFMLGFELFTRFLFYTSLIIILCIDTWRWMGLGLWLLVSLTRLIIVKSAMNRLKERDLLLPSLLLDALMPLILAAIQLSNFLRPQEPAWK